MAIVRARLLHPIVTVAAILGGVACQGEPSAPSRLPTTPSSVAPAWWSTGAASIPPPVDLGACLSGPTPACFTAPPMQVAAVGAEPVTGPPINLASLVINATVTLTWTPPVSQDAPVISYLIHVGSTADFSTPDLVSLDTFSTSTTLQASGVAPGIYYVRLRARNALGISGASNEIRVVVGSTGPVPNCPGPPRSLTGAASFGTLTLSWQPPLSGTVQFYIIEAGTASGVTNVGTLNNGLSTAFSRAGVPAGVYYIRIRAVGPGCAPSAPSNELAVTVSGPTSPGGTSVTLTLAYICNPCSGDPDNYALNVDCLNGRCRTYRTSNASRSGTVTATVSGAGVHNVEVVARFASWRLTMSGGMTPGSWRILDPPGGAGLSLGSCQITSSVPEIFTEFMVGGGSC